MVEHMPRETLAVLGQVHYRLTHQHGLTDRDANCLMAGAVAMWHWMHNELDPQSSEALIAQMTRELIAALDGWAPPPLSEVAN